MKNTNEIQITNDMMDSLLEGIEMTKTCKTSHDSLDGSIEQELTMDFSGLTLQDIVSRAFDAYRIKFQNGYARKASPEKYLTNKDGSAKKTMFIKLVEFFRGRVEKDPIAAMKRNVEKLGLEKLKEAQRIVAEQIKMLQGK